MLHSRIPCSQSPPINEISHTAAQHFRHRKLRQVGAIFGRSYPCLSNLGVLRLPRLPFQSHSKKLPIPPRCLLPSILPDFFSRLRTQDRTNQATSCLFPIPLAAPTHRFPVTTPAIIRRIFNHPGSYRILINISRHRPRRSPAFNNHALEPLFPHGRRKLRQACKQAVTCLGTCPEMTGALGDLWKDRQARQEPDEQVDGVKFNEPDTDVNRDCLQTARNLLIVGSA